MPMRLRLPTDPSPPAENSISIVSFRDFYAFEAHVKTCRKKRGLDIVEQWYDQPVFYFSNAQSLIHDGAEVATPTGCQELDYELELGIVIGKPGRNIRPEDAWDHIAGFTIVNDFSARDLQREEMKVGLGPSKGKDFATAVGPKLVSLASLRDHIDSDDKINLEMSASVNGRQLSVGNSNSMYFTWPQIVAHASRDVSLVPGELLGSGTVGTGCILELGPENTGGWLKPGDAVELTIESLGTLKNTIV
jgi:fumarylacetoacetate (FAA) hydrolase